MSSDNSYFLAMMADEKIAAARRAAAHDRLVLTAGNGCHGTRQSARSPFTRLVRTLVSASGYGRPAQETIIPAGTRGDLEKSDKDIVSRTTSGIVHL